MAEVRLKWFHTFLFLFQAILSVTDTTTDILTCLSYWQNDHITWFVMSLSVTVLTLIILGVWSIIASTSRTWTTDDEDEPDNPDVIFRNTAVNVLIGCLCVGPPLHSLQLFLFCVYNFRKLWNDSNGLRIDKDRLYHLYIHTLNLKMIEGLLEAAPQLMIQVYVMIMLRDELELIQMISAPISFLSLVWMITTVEVFREFALYDMKLQHYVVIFFSNIGIIGARTLAIIFFTLAFPWWLPLVLCTHWFLVNVMALTVWRSTGSKRIQDMLMFILTNSWLYIFVYSSYGLKKLRGSAPYSRVLQNFVSISWYFLFTAENIAMAALYCLKPETKKWLVIVVLTAVLIGNIGGIGVKIIASHCCFTKNNLLEEPQQRPETIVIKAMNR